MISSLRGTVLAATLDSLVLEVGGVGFAVAVPADVAAAARVGESAMLHTHLVVREDALSLYGFASREQLDVFGILLGVSGVGPKSALGVLSELSIEQIAEAASAEDDKPFRRVSGIGPKTAKLIAVQLQGKLAAYGTGATSAAKAPSSVVGSQVVAALTGLGWPERIALEAAENALAAASEADRESVPALLRQALAALGPAKAGARG